MAQITHDRMQNNTRQFVQTDVFHTNTMSIYPSRCSFYSIPTWDNQHSVDVAQITHDCMQNNTRQFVQADVFHTNTTDSVSATEL